jgi:hypothetical protein
MLALLERNLLQINAIINLEKKVNGAESKYPGATKSNTKEPIPDESPAISGGNKSPDKMHKTLPKLTIDTEGPSGTSTLIYVATNIKADMIPEAQM